MLNFMQEKLSVWELLRQTEKPIVLYGMGNGADKIIDWCEANEVQVQGVDRGMLESDFSEVYDLTVVGYSII